MTVEMESLEGKELNLESPFRVLIHGAAGTGKTTLCGTFPKPMWIANFDRKLKPLYEREDKDQIFISTYDPEDVKDCSKRYMQFFRDWKEMKKNPDIKTLVVDGITSLDILIVRHFVILSGKASTEKATLPIYGEQAEHYNYFFKYMVNDIDDKWVVFTAHSEAVQDETLGIIEIRPLITGSKFPPKLPGMFEETWFMDRQFSGEKETFNLWYRRYKKAVASSTILQGKGVIENPTFEKIVKEANSKGRKS